MERKSRTAIIGLLLLLMINTYSISAGKKPSGRQNREDTLRINALEFEEIDITKVKGMNAPDDVTVVLDNDTLKFDFNSDKINPKYYGILRNLIEYINVNNYRVTVVGHTDSKGTNAYNMKLGMRRAENAKKKLLELGLSADKIAGVFFPILLFVVSGFEHSVANMYYIPAGIIAKMNPEYLRLAVEKGIEVDRLNISSFLFKNLLPVTIGNLIGGTLVGLLYWYIYLRKVKK